jgi:hypothetical protein
MLILFSRRVTVCYIAHTFDRDCAQRSQNFFERREIYSCIEQCVESPPVSRSEERDIPWLLKRLLAILGFSQKRNEPYAVSLGYVLHSSGSDPRPGPLLGRHADWLLAQQIVTAARHHHLLNLQEFHSFCLHPERWGLPKRTNRRLDLSRFGEDSWDEKLRNALKRRENPSHKV